MKTIAIIVAGGASTRFGGDTPKQYILVKGRPLLSWTIEQFQQAGSIDEIVIVVAEEYLLYVSERVVDPFNYRKVSKIVIGGDSRRESVLKGLEALPISTKFVAIHDGARAATSPIDIDRVVRVAQSDRAAMLAVPITDTVKRVKDNFILSTLDRDSLYGAQTPQVFQYDLIMDAHRELDSRSDLGWVTDDASIIEKKGFKIKIVEPTSPNPKVTTAEELKMMELYLAEKIDGST